MAEVGSAYVAILPSTKGFGRKLTSELDGPSETAGRNAGKRLGGGMTRGLSLPLKSIGGAILGLGAISAFKGFIAEAQESRRVSALTAQVIKTTGGAAKISAAQVGDLATAISNKTGVDDEAIQSGANLLLTFTNVRNAVGKGNDIFNQATQTITDMSAALGQDTKSSAIQLGKALNDPIRGVTALSRVGVSFTEQQKKQIKTLVDSGKTLDAQKIILAELGKEFGGAAAATATPSAKLAVIFGNLREQIGTALLPVVDKLATFLGSTLVPSVSRLISFLGGKLGPVFAKVGKAVGVFFDALSGKSELGEFDGALKTVNDAGFRTAEVLKSIGGFVKGTVLPAIKDLYTALQPLLTQAFEVVTGAVKSLTSGSGALGSVIRSVTGFMKDHKTIVQAIAVGVVTAVAAFKVWAIITKTVAAVQAVLNAVLAANPIGIVILAVAGLVAGLIYAYKHSETFRNVVDKAFRAVGAAFDFVKDHWKLFLAVLMPALAPIILMATQIANHWDTTKRILSAAFSAVGNAAKGMWDNVLRPTFKFISDAWFTVVGALVNGAAKAFGWVPGIGGKLKAAAEKFNEFRDQVNAALDGVKDRTVHVRAYYEPLLAPSDNTPHRASGGPVAAGRRYIWQEPRSGGEIFVPDVNGQVLNRRQIAAAMAAVPAQGPGGITIEHLEVVSAPGERAEQSMPRALRNVVWAASR
jgi:hypothetical protein